MKYLEALIALGSNMDDRLAMMQCACAALEKTCDQKITAFSHVYETAPIGLADQLFLNAAVVIRCFEKPHQLLKILQSIEDSLGRVRRPEVVWGNRCIDLDIVMLRKFSDRSYLTINSPELIIPHHQFTIRDFVLFPASEVAGDWQHPMIGKTISELAAKVGRGNLIKKRGAFGSLFLEINN